MATTNQDRYVAFSGGGFNAQSMHAGWLAGGLDYLQNAGKDASSIDSIFGNVKKMSSSSGGTWWTSQLGYSPTFSKQFTSKAGRDAYNSTGYNGELKKIFMGLGFDKNGALQIPTPPGPSGEVMKAYVKLLNTILGLADKAATSIADSNIIKILKFAPIMAANSAIKSGINWRGFVDAYVNAPLKIGSELSKLNLESTRNEWASDVDFINASSMQTSDITLGEYEGDLKVGVDWLSTTTKVGKTAKVNATPVATDIPSQINFTPVSLISRAASQGGKPTASALFTAGDFKRNYIGEFLGVRNSKTTQVPINAKLSNTLGLIDVSTISSAAAAVLAGLDAMVANNTLPKLVGSTLKTPLFHAAQTKISNLLRSFAPSVSIVNGNIGPTKTLSPIERTRSTAAQYGITRMADSGYNDNSSVGYLLRDIQDTKGTTTPFNITLMMQSNEAIDTTGNLTRKIRQDSTGKKLSKFGIASEIGQLFGQTKGDGSLDGDSITNALSAPNFPIKVPSARVFADDAWYGKTNPDWTWSKGGIRMDYFKLNVKTVANKTFGIKEGQTGTLNILAATNKDSYAAPLYFNQINQYLNNYDTLREGITKQGGFAAMADALGITV